MKFPILHRAVEFAVQAHMGQDRKYSNVPYIAHPIGVMQIVRSITDDECMLIAAVLHDVVEDTPITHAQICAEFGEHVGKLVADLTDVSTPENGNRETRKRLDREHTAKACVDAKTIKLADIIHNAESIIESDPHFAKVFMHEAEALLNVLTEGDSRLMQRANQLLRSYQEGLLQDRLKSN